MDHGTSNSNNNDAHPSSGRCSEVEIRRACGSQSLTILQEAVQSGWTITELDGLSGKSALQLAAWKGCLSNVVYLVQLGCNINNYSTATYSYGKTPIFFALTQSRQDVVEYLLQCTGIQVAIVNNKGQSVLSLAATHDMPDIIVHQIQALEQGQTWWNFRATHSDGLNYGDLDPRFLDRPLQETDVITQYAINPTCHSTRKGNFARKNPHVHHSRQSTNQTANVPTNNKGIPRNEHTDLVGQQKLQFKLSLDNLTAIMGDEASSLVSSSSSSSSSSSAAAAVLLKIVQGSKSFRFAWLSQLVEVLSCHQNQQVLSSLLLQTKEMATLEPQSTDRSIVLLLDKISQRLFHTQSTNTTTSTTTTPDDIENLHHAKDTRPLFSTPIGSNSSSRSISTNNGNHPTKNTNWKQSKHQQAQALVQSILACQEVQDCLSGLSMENDLQHDDSNVLRLPMPVLVITTVTQVLELRQVLLTENVKLLAMDTEWYQVDTSNSHPQLLVSTFQLALVDSNQQLHCYIVDIQVPLEQDYLFQTRNLIAEIMESSQYFILGFSVGHDIPMLEQFVGRKLQPTLLLDLQLVLASDNDTSRLPSLKTCAALYSPIPLCKIQQCSDWGQRPLSQDQQNYAGLDAAVLLYLLAEYHAAKASHKNIIQQREA